jgi:hypothetical protein
MKTTGIFYHPSFSRKSYMTIGNLFRVSVWEAA